MDGHRIVPLLFQPRTQQPYAVVPGVLVREASSRTCDRQTEGHLTPRRRAVCRASRRASDSCEPPFVPLCFVQQMRVRVEVVLVRTLEPRSTSLRRPAADARRPSRRATLFPAGTRVHCYGLARRTPAQSLSVVLLRAHAGAMPHAVRVEDDHAPPPAAR
jgi:hypothetical protein